MPSAPLLCLVAFCMFVSSNFSDDMFAGSRVSGCSFDITCFTIHGDLGADVVSFGTPKRVIWHAWCLHVGVLGDPGTILGHWGTQERTL